MIPRERTAPRYVADGDLAAAAKWPSPSWALRSLAHRLSRAVERVPCAPERVRQGDLSPVAGVVGRVLKVR